MAKSTPRPIDHYWHKSGIYGVISRATLRTLQFIFAVTVAGLYGVDLAHATKTKTHAHTEWIYAEFVAALSALTCIVHCFVTVTQVAWSAWDGVLFILWVAQVGVFGTVYTSAVDIEHSIATLSIPRMRAAVWIDLVNMLLWCATTVLGVGWCIRTRKVNRRLDGADSVKGKGDEEIGLGIEEEKDVKELVGNADDDKCLQGNTESLPVSVDKKPTGQDKDLT
jgi:predicted membrane protein